MNNKIKKIVLVNPPMKQEQVYGEFAEWGSITPPIALCYIAAFLREKGFEIEIIDAEAKHYSITKTVKIIFSKKPDIIGITCKTLWMVSANKLAKAIKNADSSITIIAGGHHVSIFPEKLKNDFPFFDFIVIGEGEITIYELIQALNNHKDLKKVAGIAFREKNRVIITETRERIKDLDLLPMPAWDLLPNISYYYHPTLITVKKVPAFSIIGSRGCAGKCNFCDRSIFGHKLTFHGPEYMFNMIKELYFKYKIRHFLFEDDNLLVNKNKIYPLLDYLAESKLRISFSCQSRIDTINSEILRHLKKAGCWQIILGIESGSQKILDAMNKRITVKQIKKSIILLKKYKIKSMGFFIVGYPGESIETLEETVNLIKATKIDDVAVFYFTPYPGASIYKEIDRLGIYNEDWEKMNTVNPAVFKPHNLSSEILKEYYNRLFDACYFKPHQILKLFTRITSFTHFIAVIKAIPKIFSSDY